MSMQEYRSHAAQSAVGAYLILKPGSADMTVVPATAATDLLIGTSDALAKASGEMVDVGIGHVHEVICGAAVTRGQPLTSDANGKAIPAAPAAGSNVRIIGFAEVSGVLNDVITYRLSLGVMQG